MPSLKDRDGIPIKKGYYLQEILNRIAYVSKTRRDWTGEFPNGELIHINSKTFRNFYRAENPEKAAKDFEEEATARKNNLERFLKKSNGNH